VLIRDARPGNLRPEMLAAVTPPPRTPPSAVSPPPRTPPSAVSPPPRGPLPALLAELLGLVAPPTCAACRAPVPRAEVLVCAACLRALPWLRSWRCPRCALPRHSARGCPAAGAAFAGAWAPLAYEGSARALVAALKFRGALAVASLMGAQLAAHLPRALRGPPVPVLVPVPPHPVRRRRRGFDPAAELTAALAGRTGLPAAQLLRRRDRAPRQVGLGRAQRRQSGRLLIETARAPPARVLLVDDVHTTGATLDACAHALVAAGCREVVAVTYARAL
jgi:predicted amidophosphoribosyltransferase